MIDINISLFIQMANFLIFLFLMNFVLYRPIRRIVAERKKLISQKQEGIESLEAQAQGALLEYDRKLQDARITGAERIQELKASGYEQEKELLRQIFGADGRQRFSKCAKRLRRISRSLEQSSSNR